MAIVTVAVMVIVPLPVPEAALKYFSAVGGVVPAGIVNGYEMPVVVGSVQEPTQAAAGAVLMVEALRRETRVEMIELLSTAVRTVRGKLSGAEAGVIAVAGASAMNHETLTAQRSA